MHALSFLSANNYGRVQLEIVTLVGSFFHISPYGLSGPWPQWFGAEPNHRASPECWPAGPPWSQLGSIGVPPQLHMLGWKPPEWGCGWCWKEFGGGQPKSGGG